MKLIQLLVEDEETDRMKSDKEKLMQKADTLVKQRKTQQDPLRKSTMSKQISDLGSKKADINLKMQKKKQELEKQKVTEAHDSTLLDDAEDNILVIAKNERKYYYAKDAAGAIDYAIKIYVSETLENLKADLHSNRYKLIKELLAYWKREGHV
jgi:ABC-type xylose transport system substrate-binding protein